MRLQDVETLRRRREVIIADLLMKVQAEDWHGVQDCASDLREVDVILAVLTTQAAATPAAKFTTQTTESGEWVITERGGK